MPATLSIKKTPKQQGVVNVAHDLGAITTASAGHSEQHATANPVKVSEAGANCVLRLRRLGGGNAFVGLRNCALHECTVFDVPFTGEWDPTCLRGRCAERGLVGQAQR